MTSRILGVRGTVLGTLFVTTIALTGCNDGMRAEMDALKAQNTELQTELNQTRSALDQANQDNVKLSSELAAKPQTPADGAAKPASADGDPDDFGPGTQTLKTADSLTIRVEGDVLFASGQATLRTSARRTLDRIAAALKNGHSGKRVRVEGHTDSDKIVKSKWADNYQLSAERARTVMRYLASKGVPTSRMSILGHGPNKPLATKALSRRVEIVVLN